MNRSRRITNAHESSSFVCRLVCLAVLIGFSAIEAWAQSTSAGTIAGQVTDQQGAVLVGAQVRLIDNTTNTTRTTTTNDAGRYNFINVTPCVYDVTISHTGFAQSKVASQTLEVAMPLTLHVSLHLGATTTTGEVRASAGAELQTMNSTVVSTISADST